MFSRTIAEHAVHLRLISHPLKGQQIYVKASKCLIHVLELDFIGQWITTKGVAPKSTKLKVVRECEAPISVKDI